MNENDIKPLGYKYGNNFFPEETIVPIMEHVGCANNEGIVKKSKRTLEPTFVIACAKCFREGMIPVIGS